MILSLRSRTTYHIIMQIGTDLVFIPEFKQRLKSFGGATKVFLDSELAHAKSSESLAGIFAAKEAFMKAVGKKLDWNEIWVEYEPSGRPILQTTHNIDNSKTHLSISHDGDYATAIVVIE